MTRRIIARLDIKGPNVVKGINLEGLRVMGPPSAYAQHYYENGVDELLYMDVVASLYGRNSLQEVISQAVRDIFVPLTVGGGLRTIDDINAVLRAGADKVSINTAAIKNPDFIRQASLRFGASTIVVAIEAIKHDDGRYLAYTDNGRGYTGVEVFEWAKKVESLGAGEILLTSVDREGTGTGFDLELIRGVTQQVSIPVVAHGGAGRVSHVVDVFQQCPVSGVAVASILHYNYLKNHQVDMAKRTEGNIAFLQSGRSYSRIESCEVGDIKRAMREASVACRL